MLKCSCGETFASKATSRVRIQAPAVMVDAYGGRVTDWVDEAEVWAIITPATGREPFLSSQHQSRVTHKVTIRYREGLADTVEAAKRRVRLSGRTMNVVACMNLGDDMKTEGSRYQALLCVEGEPA